MRNRWIGAIGTAVMTAVLAPVLAACESARKPEAVSLACEGEVPPAAPGARTAPPAAADRGAGLTGRPRVVGTVPGGRVRVVGDTAYAVADSGEVTARRVGRATELWTVPAHRDTPARNLTTVAAQPGRPDLVVITTTAIGQADGPVVLRLADGAGKVVRTCVLRGVDERQDRAELSADGRVVLLTRTTTRSPGLSGTEKMSDRVVEARDTRGGEVLWSLRALDFTHDGRRAYLRAGGDLVARDIATGEQVWSVPSARLGDPREDVAQPLFLSGGRLYAYAERDGVIVAHDAADGRRVWSEPAGVLRGVDGVTLTHDQGVVVDGPRGVASRTAVPYTEGDAASGIVVRELHDVTATTVAYRESHGDVTNLVLVRDGRRTAFPVAGPITKAVTTTDVAYVLGGQAPGPLTLTAYDIASGRRLWEMPAPGGPYEGAVALIPFDGGLYVGDMRTGHLLGP